VVPGAAAVALWELWCWLWWGIIISRALQFQNSVCQLQAGCALSIAFLRAKDAALQFDACELIVLL